MQNNNYFVLKKILTENLIEFNSDYNISKYTPIKYPLISKLVIYPKSQTEFINTLNILKNHYEKKITCFGKFSNTIIHENSNVLNEPIIITKNLNKIEIKNNKKICKVEAGFPLPKFCKILSYENFKGFSGMLGIPGSIGGAIYMNAGSFENEISDNLISVDYIDKDLNLKTIYKKEINFRWRHSNFQNSISHLAILSAKFNLIPGDEKKIKNHLLNSQKIRSETQEKPGNNYGSVFATKWIYGESNCKSFEYKIIKKFIEVLFKIAMKIFNSQKLYYFFTKLNIIFNKKYFNIENNNNIRISNRSLNCFLINNEKTKPSDYINFILNFKKKFNPNCKVEIKIYD